MSQVNSEYQKLRQSSKSLREEVIEFLVKAYKTNEYTQLTYEVFKLLSKQNELLTKYDDLFTSSDPQETG